MRGEEEGGGRTGHDFLGGEADLSSVDDVDDVEGGVGVVEEHQRHLRWRSFIPRTQHPQSMKWRFAVVQFMDSLAQRSVARRVR
eukprot:2054134-Rhodomonas_salina.1